MQHAKCKETTPGCGHCIAALTRSTGECGYLTMGIAQFMCSYLARMRRNVLYQKYTHQTADAPSAAYKHLHCQDHNPGSVYGCRAPPWCVCPRANAAAVPAAAHTILYSVPHTHTYIHTARLGSDNTNWPTQDTLPPSSLHAPYAHCNAACPSCGTALHLCSTP